MFNIKTRTPSRKKGQGIVEYAGALVIAALIVITTMATAPEATMSIVYDTVIKGIHTLFEDYVTTNL